MPQVSKPISTRICIIHHGETNWARPRGRAVRFIKWRRTRRGAFQSAPDRVVVQHLSFGTVFELHRKHRAIRMKFNQIGLADEPQAVAPLGMH